MEIHKKSENVILVVCPPKPKIDQGLEQLIIAIRERTTNVVVDFSRVDIITASNISELLKLRKLLKDEGHRLVLSGVNSRIRSIFTTTKLHQIFEFAHNESAALALLEVA
ncbi:MAG: STAS domain-containing protein [bacterium]|nr:STAS domain-containing protein [bacterium]